MKKGISLIVLVITIIVMIILAAAIIISISNSNVINKANKAVTDTNIATIKEAAALKYADVTLAIKEAGDGSILGGKTVGEYIEQQLINDNIIEADNPYFFTDTAGAIYVPGYSNQDTDASKYRVIGNIVYYLGTDVDRRMELKDVSGVSIEYILLDTADVKTGGNYTVTSVGMQGKVTSYTELMVGDIYGNSSLAIDNVILITGMRLYNNLQEIGQVLIVGDIFPDGYIESGETTTINFSIDGTTTYEETMRSEIGTLDGALSQAEVEKLNFEPMYMLLADVNLNGKVDYCDASIILGYAYQILPGKSLSELIPSGHQYYSYTITSGEFNTQTTITNIPVDLRNKN